MVPNWCKISSVAHHRLRLHAAQEAATTAEAGAKPGAPSGWTRRGLGGLLVERL